MFSVFRCWWLYFLLQCFSKKCNETFDFLSFRMNSTGYPDTTTAATNETCHGWLKDALGSFDNVTLEDINAQLVRRNLGGIGLLCTLSFIGLIGNAHVLWIYIRQFGKSNYRVYVIWLAMIDIFQCVVVAPMVVSYLFFPVTFPSEVYCKIFRFANYFAAIASTSSLISIAVDRYKAICSPLKNQLSNTQAKLLCFMNVVVALILSWPAPFLYGMREIETGVPGIHGYRCFTELKYEQKKYQIYFNALLGLYFVAVSTTMVFVYIKIGRNIHTHFQFQETIRRQSCRTVEEVKNVGSNGARKSTITLCFVTIAYILSALPHHLLAVMIFVIEGFDCSLSLVESQVYYTFIWSYFVNSMVNPFIYGIRDKKFRTAVKQLYKRKKWYAIVNVSFRMAIRFCLSNKQII